MPLAQFSRRKLALLILLSLLPLWMLLVGSLLSQRHRALTAVERHANELTRLFQELERQRIGEAHRTLELLSRLPEVQGGSEQACERALGSLLEGRGDYANFGVIAPEGSVLCSALPKPPSVDLADRDYLQEALEHRDFSVGGFQIGRITGEPSQNFGLPLPRAEDVPPRRVLFSAMRLHRLASLLERVAPTLEGSVVIATDARGTVLAAYPDSSFPTGTPLPSELLEGAGRTASIRYRLPQTGKIARFYVSGMRPGEAPGKVRVYLGVEEDVLFASVHRAFLLNLLALSAGSLLALGLAWAGGGVALRHLRVLLDATEKITAGDLDARTGLEGSGDLARLGRALDAMADEIQDRDRELRSAEARWRALVEQSPAAFWQAEIEEPYELVYQSPHFDRFRSGEHAGARSLLELVHAEDRPALAETLSRVARTGEPAHLDHRIARSDGTAHWYSNRITLNDEGTCGPPCLQGVLADITPSIEARRSEARLMKVLDESPDLIFTSSPRGALNFMNRSARRAFALPDGQEMEGRNIGELFSRRRGEGSPDEILAAVFTQGQWTGETALRGGAGREIPASVVALGHEGDQGRTEFVTILCRDISRHKEWTRDMRRQMRRLKALHAVDLAIGSHFDLDRILQIALDQVQAELEVDTAAVWLRHGASPGTFRLAEGRGVPASYPDRLMLGEGPPGRVAEERRSLHLSHSDVLQESRSTEEWLARGALRSWFGVPLLTRGELRGVLEVARKDAFAPGEDWTLFLEGLAAQISVALDSSSLVEQLRLSHQELSLAYDATLEGWVRALDLRDRETEGHTRRVTEASVELARRLGLTGDDLLQVRRGALLHDIGKIAVPDRILHKEGRLDEEERAIVERHPIHAWEWLSCIPPLREAALVAYCHHEKWDGSGYPQGLRGEQIPLSARIFAVVDVWDALRSDRPYRKAWAEEDVLDYLRAESGTHFDPRIVDEFLALLQEDRDQASSLPPSLIPSHMEPRKRPATDPGLESGIGPPMEP